MLNCREAFPQWKRAVDRYVDAFPFLYTLDVGTAPEKAREACKYPAQRQVDTLFPIWVHYDNRKAKFMVTYHPRYPITRAATHNFKSVKALPASFLRCFDISLDYGTNHALFKDLWVGVLHIFSGAGEHVWALDIYFGSNGNLPTVDDFRLYPNLLSKLFEKLPNLKMLKIAGESAYRK